MNELPEITRFLSDLPGFDELDKNQLNAAARAIQKSTIGAPSSRQSVARAR